MAPRVMHVADTHLGRSFGFLGDRTEERRRDLLATFERICESALHHDVAALLIAGDLFDTHNPSTDLAGAVRGQFGRLVRAGVRVFVIPGNHDDYWYRDSIWRQSFEGVTVFTSERFQTETFSAGGETLSIHGLAYNADACADPLAELQPVDGSINIALLHATVDPPEHFAVERRYYPLGRERLRDSGLNYVALGHIHRQETFRDAGRIYACYPGSPEGLDMTERGRRYVALLDFAGSPQLDLLPVNARTVEQWEVDVTGCGRAGMAERLRSLTDPNGLVTAVLTGAPDDVPDLDALRAEMSGDFFALDLEDRTEMVRSQRIEELLTENTIRGYFVSALRDRIAAARGEERDTLELALKLGLIELERGNVA